MEDELARVYERLSRRQCPYRHETTGRDCVELPGHGGTHAYRAGNNRRVQWTTPGYGEPVE